MAFVQFDRSGRCAINMIVASGSIREHFDVSIEVMEKDSEPRLLQSEGLCRCANCGEGKHTAYKKYVPMSAFGRSPPELRADLNLYNFLRDVVEAEAFPNWKKGLETRW